MHRLKLYILIVFATGYCLQLNSQTFSTQQITLAEQIESAALNAPPELAYIQTSKDIYETGEDLWFKVYLLDAQTLIPSLRSKTLYLQLLNEKDKGPVWQEKYEIQNGSANGRVYLSTELKEGNYLLAAYTPNSFFNDTTEFKAIRRIKIISDITSQKIETVKPEDPSTSTSAPVKENSIQFNTFPEGGDLVSGIKSKLAFKAVNKSGEPVDVKGTLFEDNIPLLEFNSVHAGMGSFIFTPDINKKYIIRLLQPLIDSSFVLPGILSSGMTMRLDSLDTESIIFKVTQSPDMKLDSFYIRLQVRGVPYYVSMAEISKDSLIEIPLSGFPQGIAEVTLFNKKLMPVAERLVYINQYRKLNITTELLKDSYNTRGKVTFKISVKDEDGWPVFANLGITVFDKIYQNSLDSGNILSHVLLSSQLKGRIYNPSFYFNSKSKDRDEALDLLMLTQGWRKYISNESIPVLPEVAERKVIFDEIPGELYYPEGKKKIPRDQTFVIAFSPNVDSLNVVIPADSVGSFSISYDLLKRWANDYVYLKPFGRYKNKSTPSSWDPLAPAEFFLHTKLFDPFRTITDVLNMKKINYPLSSMQKFNIDTTDLYVSESGVIQIKGVTIKGQRSGIKRGKYLGILDSIATNSEDYVCVFGVLNCPRHLPGTYVPRDLYPKYPCLEEKPIQGKEYSVIYNYNTRGEYMRKITYFRPKYTEDELLKINNITRIKAFQGKRDFYKPDYDMVSDEVAKQDFRNTLLWEPTVFTDLKGEVTLSFFCSDINSSFSGRIEGVGGNGLLGAEYFSFSVRKAKNTPANNGK